MNRMQNTNSTQTQTHTHTHRDTHTHTPTHTHQTAQLKGTPYRMHSRGPDEMLVWALVLMFQAEP